DNLAADCRDARARRDRSPDNGEGLPLERYIFSAVRAVRQTACHRRLPLREGLPMACSAYKVQSVCASAPRTGPLPRAGMAPRLSVFLESGPDRVTPVHRAYGR